MKNPLRHVRFSLTGLFAATLFVACLVATLRYATRLWADALFTCALAVVAIAALGVVYRKDAARAFWLGALVGCGGYLFLAFSPWTGESIRPRLVTTPLLLMAQERMQMAFSRSVAYEWAPVPTPLQLPPYPTSQAPIYYSGPTVDAPATAGLPPMNSDPLVPAPVGGPLPAMSDGSSPPPGPVPAEADGFQTIVPEDSSPMAAGPSPIGASSGIPVDSASFSPPNTNATVPVPGFDPYAATVHGSPYAAVGVPPTSYPQYSTAVVVSGLPDWDNLERAGHSLTALLAAFVFGMIGRRFYRTT